MHCLYFCVTSCIFICIICYYRRRVHDLFRVQEGRNVIARGNRNHDTSTGQWSVAVCRKSDRWSRRGILLPSRSTAETNFCSSKNFLRLSKVLIIRDTTRVSLITDTKSKDATHLGRFTAFRRTEDRNPWKNHRVSLTFRWCQPLFLKCFHACDDTIWISLAVCEKYHNKLAENKYELPKIHDVNEFDQLPWMCSQPITTHWHKEADNCLNNI